MKYKVGDRVITSDNFIGTIIKIKTGKSDRFYLYVVSLDKKVHNTFIYHFSEEGLTKYKPSKLEKAL